MNDPAPVANMTKPNKDNINIKESQTMIHL